MVGKKTTNFSLQATVYDTGVVRPMVDVLIAHARALEFLLGPIQALDTHSEHELLHYLGSCAPAGGG